MAQWVLLTQLGCDVVHVNAPAILHMHVHIAAFSVYTCCKAHFLLGFAICFFTTLRNSGPPGAGKECP